MANIRKILTLGGAALGAAFSLYTGADIVAGICYVVAGSGVAPLSIAFGKFLIHGVADMLEKTPPESCQFVRQDIVTIFSVGTLDLIDAHRDDLLMTPNVQLFRTLFVAGASNFAPLVNHAIDQALTPEDGRERVRP